MDRRMKLSTPVGLYGRSEEGAPAREGPGARGDRHDVGRRVVQLRRRFDSLVTRWESHRRGGSRPAL